MKVYLVCLSLAIAVISIPRCTKKDNCQCVAPETETSWRITSHSGGFTGGGTPVTIDQQNNILTLKPDGRFVCINTQTGMVVNGTVTTTDFNSIYGNKPKLVFSPRLPMLHNDFHILISNSGGKLILGDNNHDGYQTIFSIVKP